MMSTTAAKPTPPPVSARRIKIPLPPAPPTTPRLGVPAPPPPQSSSSYSSSPSSSPSASPSSSARHSPSPSLASLNSYSSVATSFSPTTSVRSIRYRSGSCRHTAPQSPKCAELAGGTAAECAVVFCCCPCGIVNLLYLAVLKLPAGLCRKAIRNRRRRMIAKKRDGNTTLFRDEDDDGLLVLGRAAVLSGASTPGASLWPVESVEPSEEMWEMDKEMWNLFYGTGFWRSPSQREVQVI